MFTPGTVLDERYEIIAPLGAGGMGEVHRARRLLLGDEVAVKVVHASFDASSEHKTRFLRESRACAQLRHPNIVSILDFNIGDDGQPYLVMELLSGPSLRDELELNGPMPPQAAAEILKVVCSAVQLAHDRGITHRDLKPANIVAHRYETGERVYKVIDFGLAAVKEASDATRLTHPHAFIGTLAYAAPEQLRGEPADARTDVYALGVIAYEMVTGRQPFSADNHATLIHQALDVVPAGPGKHRAGVPAALDAAILRALAKRPADRFATALEFSRAVQAAVGASQSGFSVESDAAWLAKYDLGEMLGRGRLGSLVYRGAHRALGVPVAIRVLRRDEQPNWDAVKTRFLVEARTLQVSHPYLLQVRDYGEDERNVYVVTDYVEGTSLRQEIAAGAPFAWSRTLAILRQMLDATAALNARGGFIVGINPDMVRVTVSDGAEHIVMSTAGIRSVQDVLATMREQELRGEEANEQELPYLAPEVLLGQAPQPASDLFTIGVLACEMATGKVPFRARSLPELLGQMLKASPPDLPVENADVPDTAAALLARCIASDPAKRPASARALLAALQ